MGDLGEGEQEEEGGGAGLGMGDILGGVVTFDVTVGGASGERENESKLVGGKWSQVYKPATYLLGV